MNGDNCKNAILVYILTEISAICYNAVNMLVIILCFKYKINLIRGNYCHHLLDLSLCNIIGYENLLNNGWLKRVIMMLFMINRKTNIFWAHF